MLELMEEKDSYLTTFTRFEKEWARNERPELHRLRQEAIDRFASMRFPTLKDEEWRFTSLAPLTRLAFQPAEYQPDAFTPAELSEIAPETQGGVQLVFVNGAFDSVLSSLKQLAPGTIVTSLTTAFAHYWHLVEPHLAHYAAVEESIFTALNTASFRDGAFVFIPKGTAISEPIHLLFLWTASSQTAVCHPRTLVVADTSSQVRLVESYVGPQENVSFTNAVTEVVVGEDATVDHYKLLRESRSVFHIATLQVQQNRSSNFTSHSLTLGGSLVRNDVQVILDAEGCECTLNGLYLGEGRQHIDNHTRIDHARPHCTSHELYKGILDGKAHGVFNGKIVVHQDAQKTDAKQTNKTLLLSEDAVINTKPQLEIYADDVKCTHGATIGQLDADAIFYLRSRGLGRQEARSLLTYAFANDVISRIKVDPLRQQLERRLLAAQQLPQADQPREE
jgi:Fe-S cluster assembly protein SufD